MLGVIDEDIFTLRVATMHFCSRPALQKFETHHGGGWGALWLCRSRQDFALRCQIGLGGQTTSVKRPSQTSSEHGTQAQFGIARNQTVGKVSTPLRSL